MGIIWPQDRSFSNHLENNKNTYIDIQNIEINNIFDKFCTFMEIWDLKSRPNRAFLLNSSKNADLRLYFGVAFIEHKALPPQVFLHIFCVL